MKKHFGALFLVTIVALAGCTYSDSAEDPAVASTSSPAGSVAASPSAANNEHSSTQGDFQSQAANTTGTAAIRVTGSGAVLELQDFATENSEDLRVFLSPGTLSPTANGELTLTSTEMYELGDLNCSTGDQMYDIGSERWANTPPIGSVVIYDYQARVAYGTANLK